jgi:hypothetical protein
MQTLPQQEIAGAHGIIKQDSELDNQTAIRLKKALPGSWKLDESCALSAREGLGRGARRRNTGEARFRSRQPQERVQAKPCVVPGPCRLNSFQVVADSSTRRAGDPVCDCTGSGQMESRNSPATSERPGPAR